MHLSRVTITTVHPFEPLDLSTTRISNTVLRPGATHLHTHPVKENVGLLSSPETDPQRHPRRRQRHSRRAHPLGARRGRAPGERAVAGGVERGLPARGGGRAQGRVRRRGLPGRRPRRPGRAGHRGAVQRLRGADAADPRGGRGRRAVGGAVRVRAGPRRTSG